MIIIIFDAATDLVRVGLVPFGTLHGASFTKEKFVAVCVRNRVIYIDITQSSAFFLKKYEKRLGNFTRFSKKLDS